MKGLLKSIYGFTVIILIWFIFHYALSSSVIPSPVYTIKHFAFNFFSEILIHLSFSSYRIIISIIISMVIGLPAGIFMGIKSKGDTLLSPVLYLAYPVPKIAFLPVFMLLFGLGDLSKIILIFSIIVFQIIIGARDGIKQIPPEIFISAKSLGLNFKSSIIHVIIPALLPGILTSLRISSGIAISALFLSENYATTYGIGYYIMNNWIMADYISMFSGIIGLSLLGLAVFRMIDLAEYKLCPWIKRQE